MAIAAKVGLEIEKTDRKGVFLNALRLGEEAVYCELPDGFNKVLGLNEPCTASEIHLFYGTESSAQP
jgi:hypothetical protein